MEILFIGIGVVILMAYVSTRIKKSAAAAFEEERVDAEEFTLIKPELFLAPVENDEFLAFYAFSKEFGEEEGVEKQRQSVIKLKTLAGRAAKEIVAERRKSFDKIVHDEALDDGSVVVSGEREEKGIARVYHHRVTPVGEKVFDLEMSVLAEYAEKYTPAAELLLASFKAK